jgi:NAD(P)-dependent dehydrogenase (short-subunit alcohol dehydrogenase family)
MVELEDISENAWTTILDINLNGPYRFTQVVGEEMRGSDGGEIVNISSLGGIKGAPEMAHDGAAKAGLINLT